MSFLELVMIFAKQVQKTVKLISQLYSILTTVQCLDHNSRLRNPNDAVLDFL